MKIYGLLNSSEQIIDETTNSTCPDGYIEMVELRLTDAHIAQQDGTWLYVEPAKEIPSITKRQAMLQLDTIGLCEWACKDDYRKESCGYTGSKMFDEFGEATDDPALDRCGGRLSDCRKRFGEGVKLPFGGFPAAGLID